MIGSGSPWGLLVFPASRLAALSCPAISQLPEGGMDTCNMCAVGGLTPWNSFPQATRRRLIIPPWMYATVSVQHGDSSCWEKRVGPPTQKCWERLAVVWWRLTIAVLIKPHSGDMCEHLVSSYNWSDFVKLGENDRRDEKGNTNEGLWDGQAEGGTCGKS